MHKIAAILALSTALSGAAYAQTLKIGYIDPLSGGGASIGEVGLQHFQFLAEEINARGGINGQKVEILPLDNKTNPQESLVQAQKAIDQGARIITQGNGTAVAAALIDFVNKHNERNPDKAVIYLNYAAVDPSLTNEKCSYWHFRFDANSDMKMAALTNVIASKPTTKKVYLINQDYSFGHSVRTQARAMLKQKRPDVEIVGDEVHPLLKITDFAPYIAKIKASGADTIVTGNWGQDIALLLKAAADAGLQTDFYTYYAGGAGGPTAVKQTGLSHRVYQITEQIPNGLDADSLKINGVFRAKYKQNVWYPRVVNEMRALEKAAIAAKSNDVKAIAAKLEEIKITPFGGGAESYMRKDDHQFIQTMYVSSLGPKEAGAQFDEEDTGWAWKLAGTVKAADTVLPTTCKMERPNG